MCCLDPMVVRGLVKAFVWFGFNALVYSGFCSFVVLVRVFHLVLEPPLPGKLSTDNFGESGPLDNFPESNRSLRGEVYHFFQQIFRGKSSAIHSQQATSFWGEWVVVLAQHGFVHPFCACFFGWHFNLFLNLCPFRTQV